MGKARTDELKICPFCRGRAVIATTGLMFEVSCGNCGISTPSRLTLKEAVEMWNRRAYDLLHDLIQECAMRGYSRAETLCALGGRRKQV